MISEQKQISVHGAATHYDLTAFSFTGENDNVLEHAGFGPEKDTIEAHKHIAIIRWGPNSELFVDNEKGYAPHAMQFKHDCFVLRAAVQRILDDFDSIPDRAHIEVTEKPRYSGNAKAEVYPGVQFK